LGATLGHLGEPEAQPVHLRVDGLLGGQLLVGVALDGDQLAADLGGTDPGEQAIGLELGVGLAVAVGDRPDVIEESGQVLLGGLATAAVEGIDAGHAGAEFVRPLADRLPAPAEIHLGPTLPTPTHGLDRLGHEDSLLAALEGLGGIDEDGDHLRVGSHLRISWTSWCEGHRIRKSFVLSSPLARLCFATRSRYGKGELALEN
jgi:hypothetical protein